MLLNSEDHALQVADKVKYLFFSAEGRRDTNRKFFPHFYVEARVDFNDVRTGFRQTVSLNRALEIYSENAELLWAGDMIREIDPRKITSVKPHSVLLGCLPGFVDANFISRMETQFLQYLLRSFAVRIYRNFALDIYSYSRESLQDFVRRCHELLDGPLRQELDSLHEVFNRRLGQIAQKHLHADESGPLEDARADAQNKNAFCRCSERIAGLFLNAAVGSNPAAESPRPPAEMRELEERLFYLEWEACRAITEVKRSYTDKAWSVDEYIIHPNLKDIHLVRSCILWMPLQAA